MRADPGDGGGDRRPLGAGGLGERRPEAGPGRVDRAGASGLGIDQGQNAHPGQFQFPGVDDLGHHQIVANAQPAQGRLPAGPAQEVGDDHDHSSAPGEALEVPERPGQVGPPLSFPGPGGENPVEQGEEPGPAGRGGDGHHRSTSDHHGPDPVGQPGGGQAEGRRQPDHDFALLPGGGSEVLAGRDVDEQPQVDLVVGHRVPDMDLAGAGGDVPVDQAHVVTGHVGATVARLRPRSGKQAQVLSLDEAPQPTIDHQLEAGQDAPGFGPRGLDRAGRDGPSAARTVTGHGERLPRPVLPPSLVPGSGPVR